MAQPIEVAKSQRGSVIVETAPVLMVLISFLSGIFIVSYLVFAETWVRFQGEQALYCLAEGRSVAVCKYKLHRSLREFLPWGESQSSMHADKYESFAEVLWKFQIYRIKYRRKLTPEAALKKDLRWSQ
jgi:hypothetical protein